LNPIVSAWIYASVTGAQQCFFSDFLSLFFILFLIFTNCVVLLGGSLFSLPFVPHRFPPLAKHIVDKFGHGLGATVASPVGTVLQVLHHLPNELCEEVGDVLVALSC